MRHDWVVLRSMWDFLHSLSTFALDYSGDRHATIIDKADRIMKHLILSGYALY